MNNKRIRIIGGYSLFLGFSVLIMWVMILKGGEVTEGKTEMTFHLVSEFLMALLCILSGLYLLGGQRKWMKVNMLAHAMVIYSVLNAAGYYGQKEELAMMLMFLVLFLLSLASVIILTKSE